MSIAVLFRSTPMSRKGGIQKNGEAVVDSGKVSLSPGGARTRLRWCGKFPDGYSMY